MFSRWTVYQAVIILLLVVFTRFIDMFQKDIGVPITGSSTERMTQALMTFLFICTVIGLFSLLMYVQTKKSDTFLKHRLWEKMHILIAFILVVSIVALLSLVVITPFDQVVQDNRWLIYLMLYWLLFLLNVFVLAVIHKAKKNSMSNGRKTGISFIWTTAVLAAILFVL